MLDVGLNYLSLARSADTLSGGEAQRIRLASQIGAGLVGVLYVLDEPSIGLHQRDNEKLINTLNKLRDLGNSVLVVEHDDQTIKQADWVIDIGPGAGAYGGEIVFEGKVDKLLKVNTQTAQYLSNKKQIQLPKIRQSPKEFLTICQASGNNLKNIDAKIALGMINVVTGVSGSGKSTLINGTLYPYCANRLLKSKKECFQVKEVEGVKKT